MSDGAVERPVVVRAKGRPDGVLLPVVGSPPYPGQAHSGVGLCWVDDGALLAVTTWGSSSNPTVPRTALVDDAGLTLTFADEHPDAEVRSADLAAYTTLVEPPAGVDPRSPTRVRIGEREVDLPGQA